MTPDHSALIERLEGGIITSNEFDVLWEIATFEPDEAYRAARANFAGTKVIYTMANGSQETHWAPDWHLQKDRLRPLPSAPNQAKEAGQ